MGVRNGRPGKSHGGTSRGCTWVGNRGLGYNLQTFDIGAVATIGAEPTSTVVTVAGFGAVRSTPPAPGSGLPLCQVVLDVADGASLRAQLQANPTRDDSPPPTIDEVCARLGSTVTTMLKNLREQQGQ